MHKIGEYQKRKGATGDPICACHHPDPANMLAGERALWSDAEAASHNGVILEEHSNTSPKGAGKGSSGSADKGDKGGAVLQCWPTGR